MYKNFCTTSQANSISSVLTGSLLDVWSSDCIYISLENLPHLECCSEILQHLPLLLSIHVTTLFLHAHAVYIHPKYLKKGSFGKSISRRSKTSLKYCCFSVSTINSMNGVLCSVIVSERLKMRKILTGYHLWCRD